MEPEHQPKEGQPQPAWLGLNLSPKAGRVMVSTHMAASPLRLEIMPGDEIVAIDGLRTSNLKSLETALKGKSGQAVAITYAHEGIIREHTLSLPSPPHHNVKLVGKGNNKWRAYIATRQTNK